MLIAAARCGPTVEDHAPPPYPIDPELDLRMRRDPLLARLVGYSELRGWVDPADIAAMADAFEDHYRYRLAIAMQNFRAELVKAIRASWPHRLLRRLDRWLAARA